MNRNTIRRAVFACYFLMGITFATWASRIPDIKTALALSDGALGKVLFALPIGQLLCLQFSGKLVARYGSNRILPFALPGYALSLVVLGLATSPAALALGLFFFGVLGNVASISVNTQGVLAEKLYGRPIMAAFHGAWSMAGFTGGLVGLAAMNLHLSPLTHFLIIMAIVSVIIPSIRSFFAPSEPSAEVAKAEPGKPRTRDPILLQLGIIGFCSMATEGAMFDWSGVYFKDVVHAPQSLVILGYTSFMVMMASGRFIADRLLAKFGRKLVLQFSGAMMSLGLFSAVLFPWLVPSTLAFMLVGLGVSSVVPIVYSLAGQNGKVDPGVALATVSSVSFLGFLMGPPLIGFIASQVSLRGSYSVIGCFGLLIPWLASKNKSLGSPTKDLMEEGDPCLSPC